MSDPIELHAEVYGTPEEVWQAIATGPGISVWFVPTDVEEREGGAVEMHHGPGMDERATVTAYDAPHRFAFEVEPWAPTEAATPERTVLELHVEARSGGTCVVRLVSSGFGDGADWDRLRESTVTGWERCLAVLRVYLEHFAGRPHATAFAGGEAPAPAERGWAAVLGALGLGASAVGDRIASGPGAPAFAGVVEQVQDHALTVRLEAPGPGVGAIAAGGPADVVYAQVSLTLFGDDADAVAGREQPAWEAWMDEHFPTAVNAAPSSDP